MVESNIPKRCKQWLIMIITIDISIQINAQCITAKNWHNVLGKLQLNSSITLRLYIINVNQHTKVSTKRSYKWLILCNFVWDSIGNNCISRVNWLFCEIYWPNIIITINLSHQTSLVSFAFLARIHVLFNVFHCKKWESLWRMFFNEKEENTQN